MERVSMIYWLKNVWQKLGRSEAKANAEVERIAALQQAAVQRRAEYAAEQERSAGAPPGTEAASPGRKRMREAESAHAAALQAWDNKQFRR